MTTTNELNCAGCRTARAASRVAGRAVQCRACGADVTAPPTMPAQRYAPDRPAEAIEPLEYEGRAHDAPTEASAAKDLENLARMLPAIEGSAMSIAPTPGGGGHRDGRPDGVDRRTREMAWAMLTLRRLDALNPIDAAVMWFVYVYTGYIERTRWDATRGTMNERLGFVFAEKAQRRNWLMNSAKGQGTGGAVILGTRLRTNAEEAYASASSESVANSTHVLLNELREAVSALVAKCDADSQELNKAREQNRVAARRSR